MADQYTRSLFNTIRGAKTYTMYPVVAGGQCAGVALPHDNDIVGGQWGVWTQILLAAGAPAVEFWYCGFQILLSLAAGEQQHSVRIGSGLAATPPTPIHDGCNAPGRAAAAAGDTVFTPCLVPYPIYMPAATPISGQSAVTAKAAATNITVAVLLATGM